MSYQLFAGKFAKEHIKIDDSQALNTADCLTYRIPSLLSVRTPEGNERLIALFDFSQSGGDFGRIQVKERYSDDGGKTFSKMKTVLSLPVHKTPQTGKDFYSAFAIDPILVQCKNGDVLLFVDVYPESKGLMQKTMLNHGSGYVDVDGKKYLALYKQKTKLDSCFSKLKHPFTVRENGIVFSPDGKATNYILNLEASPDCYFEDYGDLYYNNNGVKEYCGNVFLSKSKPKYKSTNPKTVIKREVGPNFIGDRYSKYDCIETSPAPLSVSVKSYLWMLRSKDGGITWDKPVDITADLMLDDEQFLGTGPGVATCLSNGRILVPLYNTKDTCVAFSDDNGITWKRSKCSLNIDETQLIECLDGSVLCFGRQTKLGKIPMSLSKDKGETWTKIEPSNLCSIKCQKSIISIPLSHYVDGMDKNSTYVLASTPTGHYNKNSQRYGGAISIGKVNADYTIDWLKSMNVTYGEIDKNNPNYNFFAYSCLTPLNNDNFAIFYEALPSGLGIYEEFSLNQLFNSDKLYIFS